MLKVEKFREKSVLKFAGLAKLTPSRLNFLFSCNEITEL